MNNILNNKFFIWTASAFVFLLCVSTLFGIISEFRFSANDYNNVITVTGSAEIFTSPDIAKVSFSVENEQKELSEAQKNVEESTKIILEKLEEKGIEKEDIQTQNYNTNPNYEYIPGGCTDGRCLPSKHNLIGYKVYQTIEVVVRDLDLTGDVIGVIGSENVYNINGPRFEVEDIEELKRSVRGDAISDAKENASRLAKELDSRLGKMISFSEGGGGGYYPEAYAVKSMAFDGAEEDFYAEPTILEGQEKIEVSVTMVFKLK